TSRARIVAAADTTRRRIERDLHDGAQQRLVSLALQLRGPAQASPLPAAGELAAQMNLVAGGMTEVLDELREIARGLHPAALAEGGLPPAIKTLARRSAVPVRLDIGVDGRLPEPIELAAYYVIAEALTNTAKHSSAPPAAPASSASPTASRPSAAGSRCAARPAPAPPCRWICPSPPPPPRGHPPQTPADRTTPAVTQRPNPNPPGAREEVDGLVRAGVLRSHSHAADQPTTHPAAELRVFGESALMRRRPT
ncbi:MAG: histidine kinase, partial [Blastococcus sp.]|nr:histidine kinase [Blastococcus sp.]